MAKREFNQEVWKEIIVKVWKDPKEKENFLKDPGAYLEAMDIEVPSGKKIVIDQIKNDEFHLILPEKPVNVHAISETELAQLAAAKDSEFTSPCVEWCWATKWPVC